MANVPIKNYITREVFCMMMAVRGAVQVESNNPGPIKESVVRLIKEIAELNDIGEDDIVSIVFSQTKDITTLNPATALRETGFAHVPLFCTQEPDYSGSMPRVIRVLVTAETEEKRKPVPVYLGGAENLRSDLFKKE